MSEMRWEDAKDSLKRHKKWRSRWDAYYCECFWNKTVPPVDGCFVLHLFPSFHPQLLARPAPDFWSVETHLARHLQPLWSQSHADSSSALCWWRFLSARLGFSWRRASLLKRDEKKCWNTFSAYKWRTNSWSSVNISDAKTVFLNCICRVYILIWTVWCICQEHLTEKSSLNTGTRSVCGREIFTFGSCGAGR